MNSHHVPHHSNSYPSKKDRVIDIKASINPKQVTPFLLSIIAVLTGLSVLSHLAFHWIPALPMRHLFVLKFSLNQEQNFPTFYSALGLFYCSALFWLISSITVHSRKSDIFYWRGLSFVFAYLGLDELLAFHEQFNEPLNKRGIDGLFHYAWVIPAIIAIVIFFMMFYKFFLRLPNFLKGFILSAIALWVGGAIFVETLGGYYAYLQGKDNIIYILITHVEEVMEMLGVVVLIHGLLLYLDKIGIHQIQFSLNLKQNPVADPNLNAQH